LQYQCKKMKIGVLALQGAFIEHIDVLRQLGVEAVEVRTTEQLQEIDGLILPGGESTTMSLIAERWGLVQPLKNWVALNKPTFGTCAGLILLSNQATNTKQNGQVLIGGFDITVNRNAFGRQIDSKETWVYVHTTLPTVPSPSSTSLPPNLSPAIFIRSPSISRVGDHVQVLATLKNSSQGEPNKGGEKKDEIVAIQSGRLMGFTFHPELSSDRRWHQLFINVVQQYLSDKSTSLSVSTSSSNH